MNNDGPTVFVVDDDASMRRALTRLLRSEGFLVETFGSGGEFLEAVAERRRGCVVLDVRMRGMSGFDVMGYLAACARPLPVILVTADGDRGTTARAIKAGCVRFLAKPFEDDMLLDAVREAFRRDDISSGAP